MKYRNTKTGAVILTHCKLTGGSWQLLEPAAPAEAEDTSENAQPPKSDRPQTGAKPAAPAAKKPAAKSAAGRKGK